MIKTSVWMALTVSAALGAAAHAPGARGQGPKRIVSARIKRLTRSLPWRLVSRLPINFDTHHPQGLVKVGDHFFVSSVEVRRPTRRFAEPRGGYDRDAGEGVGHLFKFDARGNLISSLTLGEGTIYHPGGIDYDGRSIWVPVAEYRPHSRSIVYRVDPRTMKAAEAFRYGDHLGAIVHNTDDRALHGVSWGSRYFYRWALDGRGRVLNASVPRERLRQPNHAHYIDYQDCHYLGRREMLCGGLSLYQQGKDGARFSLGGLEMIDLATHRATSQMPVEIWTDSGLPMTQNPYWIEPTAGGLRAYFMPEDNRSTLYIYEIEVE